jgi:hypothetical protein
LRAVHAILLLALAAAPGDVVTNCAACVRRAFFIAVVLAAWLLTFRCA